MAEPKILSFKVTNYRYDEPRFDFKSEDIFYRYEFGWSQWMEADVFWIQLSIKMILKTGSEPEFSRIVTRTDFEVNQAAEVLEFSTDCLQVAFRATQNAMLKRQEETKAQGMRMAVMERVELRSEFMWLLGLQESGFDTEIVRKGGIEDGDSEFKERVVAELNSKRPYKVDVKEIRSTGSKHSGWKISATYLYDQTSIVWSNVDRMSDEAPKGLAVTLGDVWIEEKKKKPRKSRKKAL